MSSLRSPSATVWLFRKEWRALMASSSWWVMLVLIGPLVGVSFVSATRTYAELSVHDAAAGVGEAFSPLIGVWAPTFSACELAAAFLLPFVAIRVAASDRMSGALKIELQRPLSPLVRVGVKTLILLAGWGIASLAPVLGIVLWQMAGGSVYLPEVATVLAGHLVNAALTVSLAAAAATVTDHPSTAAIVTLGVTVGTWVLSFVAAVHGGFWERAAEYTPTAIVSDFQHGLIRLSVVLAAMTLIVTGPWIAAIWLQLGRTIRRRVVESLLVAAGASALLVVAPMVRGSWDTSENRMNSFAHADERRLRAIDEPLRITAYLAPEDPRRSDLERQALAKLRRVMRDIDVRYVSTTTTGLFEQTSEHYGEIHYRLGSRETVSRSTTVEGVLDALYALSGQTPTDSFEDDERDPQFRGHPLARRPTGAELVFYGAWPAITLLAALRRRRRGS
jgi:hypothetical protein